MTDPRSIYARGLRDLANLLDRDPALPLPNDIRPGRVTFYAQGDDFDTVEDITDLMSDLRLERDSSADFPVTIHGTLAGLPTVVRVVARLALAGGQKVSAPELSPRLAGMVRRDTEQAS